MIIETFITEQQLIDLNSSKVNGELKLRLEGKLIVHGTDYIDDEFYEDVEIPMMIDTTQQFVYIQEDDNLVSMKRLLSREILSIDDEGEMMVFADEIKFKGTLKEIKEKLEKDGSKEF